MDQLQRALDSYIKGHAYRKAVELARRAFPAQVVGLQETTTQLVTNITRKSEKFADQLKAGQATMETAVGSGMAQTVAQIDVMNAKAESFSKDANTLDRRTADGTEKLQLLQREAGDARSLQQAATEEAFSGIDASSKVRMDQVEGFV